MSTGNSKSVGAGWALVISLALVPLVRSSVALQEYLLPRTLFFSLWIIAGAGYLLSRKKEEGALPTPALIWVGLFLWFLLGLGTIYSKPEWWFTSMRYGLYGGILITFIGLFRTQLIRYEDFAKGMSLYAIVGGLMALGAWSNSSEVYEAYAPFGHKNFTSAALLVALLSSLYVYQAKIKTWNWIALAGIVISTLVIILLRTRGVWLAAIISSGFLVFANRYLRPKGYNEQVIPTKYLSIGIGALLIGIIAMIAMPKNQEKIFDSANVEFRLKYWDSSIQMIGESPLYGVGAGQWKLNFPKYGLQGTNTRVSNGETTILRPHNDILWMFSEGGLVGGLLFLSFFATTLYLGTIRLVRSSNVPERMSVMSAMAIIISMQVYGLAEFPIERVSISVPVFIAAAWILSESKSKLSNKWVSGGFAIIVGLLVAQNSMNRLGVQPELRDILDGNERQNPSMIIQAYDKHDLDVIDVDLYGNPLPYFNGLARFAAGQQSNGRGLLREAKESFDYALELHPWHLATYNQYGNWYKTQGDYEQALIKYEEGITISPYSIELRLNKAEIRLLQNKPDGCVDILLNFVGQDEHPKYQRLSVQALRKVKGNGPNVEVNDFVLQTDIASLNDRQLFMAFIRYRNSLK